MSKDNYYKTVRISVEDGETQYFVFPRLQNYESIEVTIEWTDFNIATGTLQLQEGINNVWVDIPKLVYEIEDTSGTVALQNVDFGNKDIRLKMEFCPETDDDSSDDSDDDSSDCVTEGDLIIYLLAKTR